MIFLSNPKKHARIVPSISKTSQCTPFIESNESRSFFEIGINESVVFRRAEIVLASSGVALRTFTFQSPIICKK